MSQKQALQDLISKVETKKFREGEAKGLMTAIQEEQVKALTPVFEKLANTLAENMLTQFERIIKVLSDKTTQVDFTETNKLLSDMKDELNKPCQITLDLQ